MKYFTESVFAFVLLVLTCTSAVAANCPSALSLPTATPANSVTFGDGISYSLPILGISVPSSPGQIQDCIVVATGVNGGPSTTNIAGVDNAYQTPNGTNLTTAYFRTGDPISSPDPNGAGNFAGDTATTWDARLSALSSFLNGNDLVVYFNHNQTGNNQDTTQDLFVWAQIRLVDDQGNLPTLYYYVTSVPNSTGLTNFGAPGGDPFAYTGPQQDPTCTYPTGSDAACTFPKGGIGTGTGSGDATFMVRARGHVCLSGPVGVGVPVPCGSPLDSGNFVNNNLGANEVANAVVFPEINNILRQAGFGGYDVLQADIRMGCNAATITGGICPQGSVINNGYEQIFIAQLARNDVPEPQTLALLGLGLLIAGFTLRRKA